MWCNALFPRTITYLRTKLAHGTVVLAPPGLAAENVLKAGEFFGICGFASVDWVNCEFACQYLGAPCSSV